MRLGFKGNVLKAISYLKNAIELAENKCDNYLTLLEEAKIMQDEERQDFCESKYEKWNSRKEELEEMITQLEDMAVV